MAEKLETLTSSHTTQVLPRLFCLQALRGFAAFGITAAHVLDMKLGLFNPAEWPITTLIKNLLDAEGGAGVDVFFVLSGFLISGLHTHSSARHGVMESVKFCIKRFFRIFPLYWVVLATMVAHLVMGGLMPWSSVKGYLSFRVITLTTFNIPFVAPAWTLPYEVWFYAGTGLLLLCCSGRRLFFALMAWGCVHQIIYLLIAYGYFHTNFYAFYEPELLNFFLGVVVGYLTVNRIYLPSRKVAYSFIAFSICALVAGAVVYFVRAPYANLSWAERVYFWGIPAAFAVSALSALEIEGKLATPRWMVRLGDVSYSTYLWHFEVAAITFSLTCRYTWFHNVGPLVLGLCDVVSTILLSFVSWRLIEKPFQALGRKILRWVQVTWAVPVLKK